MKVVNVDKLKETIKYQALNFINDGKLEAATGAAMAYIALDNQESFDIPDEK